MSVSTKEELFVPGDWTAEVDATSEHLKEFLDGNKRPKKNTYVTIFDADNVAKYKGVLLRVLPGDKKIVIGGRGLLWVLGAGAGPMIEDREYVSLLNKLSNGDFELPDGLYWRRVAEESRWQFGAGSAVTSGTILRDDALESDEPFPTRPGHAYRVMALGVSGTGRMRVRTLYGGTFAPPNVLLNPAFDFGALGWTLGSTFSISQGGQRSGAYALKITDTPKPQLNTNSGFESGGLGWSVEPETGVITAPAEAFSGENVMALSPIPQPEFNTNSGFESGGTGWSVEPETGVITDPALAFTGSNVMALSIIPKPQLVTNGTFEGGTGWSGAGFAIISDAGNAHSGTGVLRCDPNPRPQYITDPGFETGAGWTDVIGPPERPMSDDIDLVNLPAEAREGNWVMQVGPVTQHQLVPNAQMIAAQGRWYQNTETADPSTVYSYGSNTGMDGTSALDTAGVAGAPNEKYLRAQFDNGAGVTPATVVPGDQYDVEGYVKVTTGTDGRVWANLHIPHPTQPNRERRIPTDTLRCDELSPDTWNRLGIASFSIPENRTELNLVLNAHDQHAGTISWDNWTITRTRGNRAQIDSNTAYPVEADTSYALVAHVRASGDMKVGNVRIGVILKGAGLEDRIVNVDQGSTDWEWTTVTVDFRAESGYTTATPFVAGLDIIGEPIWVDGIYLYKTSNNTATFTGTAATVLPEQRYTLSSAVKSGLKLDGGTVRIGVTLTGAGVPPLDFGVEQGTTKNAYLAVTTDVRVPAGYTTATPYVRTKDVIGDVFYVDNVKFEQADNNTRQTNKLPFAIAAEQRYTLSADLRSALALTNGTVTVGVVLSGPGLANEEVVIAEQSATKNVWAHISTEVRAGVGYTAAAPFLRSKDLEGGAFYVDNVSMVQADNNSRQTNKLPFPVIPDQRYQLAADIRSALAATNGTVTLGVVFSGPGLSDTTQEIVQGLTEYEWAGAITEVRPPPDYTSAALFLRSLDVLGGAFYVDNVKFTKIDNNTDESEGTITNSLAQPIGLTPERTYQWVAQVRSGANLQRGTVHLAVRCLRPGYPTQLLPSAAVGATDDTWTQITFDFTLPSGYETVEPLIVATDVEGDAFYVDEGDLRDTDTTTAVFDSVTDSPTGTDVFVDSVAPLGAEFVRAQFVAEQGSSSWHLEGAFLGRTGATAATGNSIVPQLLVAPVTAGTISCPEVIPHDWHVLNMTFRQALEHYCKVVSSPRRVFRINPDGTIDVGTEADVFTDHGPANALLSEDIDVEPLPDVEVNVEDRADLIKVIGAERVTATGQRFLIEVVVRVPGTSGNRMRIIQDATIDHFDYALAYATDEAAKEAAVPLNMNVTLTGTGSRPECPPGDTIYLYKPESGLEDRANPISVRGRDVFPRGIQVQGRDREYGPSHRFQVTRENGTTFDLPVQWSREDTTTLTLGDRIDDAENDPDGPKAGVAYLRHRAQRPR